MELQEDTVKRLLTWITIFELLLTAASATYPLLIGSDLLPRLEASAIDRLIATIGIGASDVVSVPRSGWLDTSFVAAGHLPAGLDQAVALDNTPGPSYPSGDMLPIAVARW